MGKRIWMMFLLVVAGGFFWSPFSRAADLATTAEVQMSETGVSEANSLQLGLKTTIEVGPSTRYAVVQEEVAARLEKIVLEMEKGSVLVDVKAGLGRRAQVRIKTPNAIAKCTTAEFQVLHDEVSKRTTIRVTRGVVTVTDRKGLNKKIVRKDFETTVDRYGRPSKTVRIGKVNLSTSTKAVTPDFATFTFGPGVSAEDEAIIRKGIADMANYLMKWFGKTVTSATAIKTTADDNDVTCCNVGGSGSGAWITFHTKHVDWIKAKLAALLFTDMRQQLALHELVHTYQTQYGCGKQEQPVALRWYNEGMAEWLSFRAMVEMGVVTEAQVLDFNKFMFKDAKAETLSAYELYHKGVDYSVFYLAIDQLMKKSPITSLSAFCEDLGKGQSKTEAFQSAFGTSLSQFYADFEKYRLGL